MTKINRSIIDAFHIHLDDNQFTALFSIDHDVRPIGDILYDVLENLRKYGESKIEFTPEQEAKYQKIFAKCNVNRFDKNQMQLFALNNDKMMSWVYAVNSDLSLNQIGEVIFQTLVTERVHNPNVKITIKKEIQQQWQYQKERYEEAIRKNNLITQLEETCKEVIEECSTSENTEK